MSKLSEKAMSLMVASHTVRDYCSWEALWNYIAELEAVVDELIEIGDRLVFPDGVFDDEQSVIERDWRILTKAVKEREE